MSQAEDAGRHVATVHHSGRALPIQSLLLAGFALMCACGQASKGDESSSDFKEASSSGFSYRAPGCDFAVVFPVAPTIRALKHPILGQYEEAGLSSTDPMQPAMLRTECIPVKDNLAKLGGPTGASRVLNQQLDQFALAAGLDNTQIKVSDSKMGPMGELRGTKMVGGYPAIYVMRSFVGRNSNLNVYIGGAAKSFPQAGSLAFLESVVRD